MSACLNPMSFRFLSVFRDEIRKEITSIPISPIGSEPHFLVIRPHGLTESSRTFPLMPTSIFGERLEFFRPVFVKGLREFASLAESISGFTRERIVIEIGDLVSMLNQTLEGPEIFASR